MVCLTSARRGFGGGPLDRPLLHTQYTASFYALVCARHGLWQGLGVDWGAKFSARLPHDTSLLEANANVDPLSHFQNPTRRKAVIANLLPPPPKNGRNHFRLCSHDKTGLSMDLVLKIRDRMVGPGAAGVTGRCCSDFVEITDPRWAEPQIRRLGARIKSVGAQCRVFATIKGMISGIGRGRPKKWLVCCICAREHGHLAQ